MRQYAERYFKFLISIDWDDDLYVEGLKEGKLKFLSNMMVNSKRGSRHLKMATTTRMRLLKKFVIVILPDLYSSTLYRRLSTSSSLVKNELRTVLLLLTSSKTFSIDTIR
jgi:hypothetical protein